MPIPHVHGLDHVMVLCRDLDAAAAEWVRFGFTLSPRGEHGGPAGTANHTIMLARDYVEIIGVLRATEHNAQTRDFLARRGDGIERVAMLTTDAPAGLEALRARGIAGLGPTAFDRTRALPGEAPATARFRGFWWPVEEAPGDLRLRACQHLTPDLVWQPALLAHANGATGIKRLEFVAPAPEASARRLAGLLDAALDASPEGGWRVSTGDGRADFVFLDHAGFARRHPAAAPAALPEEGVAALVIGVADLARAAGTVATPFLREGAAIEIGADRANGVVLRFEPA